MVDGWQPRSLIGALLLMIEPVGSFVSHSFRVVRELNGAQEFLCAGIHLDRNSWMNFRYASLVGRRESGVTEDGVGAADVAN